MTYDLQFVDQITASPTVRLNLKSAPWTLRDGTEFPPPELRRSVVSTLLTDGDRYPAAAYGNRTLEIVLQAAATATDDEVAAALQTLYRELDRPCNILRYRPGTTEPVFFRTFRAGPSDVVWNPVLKEVTVTIPAEPFALGLRETLPAVTVYNDPAEGTTLNANPYFETDASGWTATGGTIARSTAQFHEGVASLLLTPNGVATEASARTALVAVTAGQQARASAWVRCAVSRNVIIAIDWHNSGGTFISQSGTFLAVTAGTWTLLDVSGTAPVGAAFALLKVAMDTTPPAGHTLHIDEARIRQAGAVGSMCFDVTSPKGDVETGLFLSVRAADVARVPESPVTGRRQSVIAVRRGGTPAAAPVVLQVESLTAGVDTTPQPASGSSGTFFRTTFATATSLQVRADTSSGFPSAPSVDARGTYRVFVRCRKSVAGDAMQLQMRYVNGDTYVTSDLVAGPAGTVWRWVDMGLVQMPLGYDPGTDGLSGVSLPVGGMAVNLYAARTSGSGTLDLDVIVFLPADDRMSLVKWPDSYISETAYVVDPVAGQAYGLGSSGEVRSALLELIGGGPLVTPGVANRIWMVRDVGSTWSAGDDVTASVQVTPYYWPRYLMVRGVSS